MAGLRKKLWRPAPGESDIPELAAMRAEITAQRIAKRISQPKPHQTVDISV